MMNKKFFLCTGLVAAMTVFAVPAAYAQEEGDDLDGMEMDVMDAESTPNDASTKVLTLPETASDQARERGQRGLDTANSAREDGAAFGAAISEDARDTEGGRGGPPAGTPNSPPEEPPTSP